MTDSSPPPTLPSFDPAIHLHSDSPGDLPSQTFSDEFEALNLVRGEQTRNKIVIQHRSWNLSDVFRSDEDVRPDTPTRPSKNARLRSVCSPPREQGSSPSSPPTPRMPFISSPVVFPSSAPSPDSQKRKNGEHSQVTVPKRQKIMGGFLDDDDDNEDELEAFNDAQLESQFAIQEQSIEHPSQELPEIPRAQPSIEFVAVAKPAKPTLDRGTADVLFTPPRRTPISVQIKTCSGKTLNVPLRKSGVRVSYERLVASRSVTAPGRAQKDYYGIEIHKLLDEATKDIDRIEASKSTAAPLKRRSVESPVGNKKDKKLTTAMWTEKYRARKYTELIGDERTNRSILRWLRGWDSIVYPNLARSKHKKANSTDGEERPHRKVLLLCGPPGLGKTTLAHVCARQAGYEVLEINASDERSRDVVKGRIRDALGTENVKGMNVEVGEQKVRKVGRPVCVVVDEVDGVVSGSGGSGEGGFMKALIDLFLLDQKSSSRTSERTSSGRKKKSDNFQFLRPLILVCNDVYHSSLRPLRASSIAEIIHVRQAPLENVVSRMKSIFTLEGIPSDNDGVRRLCEASWGLAKRKQAGVKSSGAAEGDIRSVLVAAEWVAHKLRSESSASLKLTRNWLEQHVLGDTGGSSFFKGVNRGGVRDIVDRVFTEGAGFPDVPIHADSFQDPFDRSGGEVPIDVASIKKRHAISRLREMVDASGDHDRCTADCFSVYPLQPYQDDTFLSKPNAAYDWLHFHDTVSSRVYSAHDWELGAYLGQAISAFHLLFATAQGRAQPQYKEADEEEEEEHPFSGPRADFAAFEALKQNQAILTGFQSCFSAPLLRLFRSPNCLATELVPNIVRMLSPDVKPVVVRGNEQKNVASVRKESERALVQAAVRVMTGLGITFEKVRVEGEGGAHSGWAYRMEPPLDSLVTYSKANGITSTSGPVRYAIRQVLDQEYRKETVRKQSEAMPSTTNSGKKTTKKPTADGQNPAARPTNLTPGTAAKRDFFGRIIQESLPGEDTQTNTKESSAQQESSSTGRRVWVTYHDGFSNAVRKPISMDELLAGL
ncbi:putative sister chromatid cohesion factor (Chl12) [Aspergillus lucknowensis]|uniref:AAA+ ATPase domain-containing protein n=1 Tax=Aspergillus lucknowensis TaxID=176173 RepID=A0ABR4LRJ6_9EURO